MYAYISLFNIYVILKSLGLVGMVKMSKGMFDEMHKLEQDLYGKEFFRRVFFSHF